MPKSVVSRRAMVAGAVAIALSAGLGAAVQAGLVNAASGVAIEGYDPVAYFTAGKPVKGSPKFSAAHDGATWRFSSAENRDAFSADPARYAPQFGGYCAWAVSQGYTAKIDPAAWKVVNDKLYLNYSKSVQQRWFKDIPGNIASADANWPGLRAGN